MGPSVTVAPDSSDKTPKIHRYFWKISYLQLGVHNINMYFGIGRMGNQIVHQNFTSF